MLLSTENYVILRDGKVYDVTDVNNEDRILVGYEVHPEMLSDPDASDENPPVNKVTDFGEVTHVLDRVGNTVWTPLGVSL